MRLSNKIINLLQRNIIMTFGDVNIYLYGSRTDDTKKGGDIDIAIDTDLSRQNFSKKEIFIFSQFDKIRL